MSLASDQRRLLSWARIPLPPLDRHGQGQGSSDNPDSPQRLRQCPPDIPNPQYQVAWRGGQVTFQSHT